MDKAKYVSEGIAMYAQAMINSHYATPELVWLYLKTECERKLDQLAEIDSPDFGPE